METSQQADKPKGEIDLRPFKFRAWNNGKFEYFDLHNITVPDRVLMSEKYPVQQFTGLNDKNGKEIYEGDIISYEVKTSIKTYPVISEVKWENYRFELIQYTEHGSISMPLISSRDYLVIGNIFEKKE